MKKLVLSVALAIGLGGLVFAQARGPVQARLDAFIAEAADKGTIITYSEVEMGADLSMTIRDVLILSEEGKTRISAPWVIAKPLPSAPDRILFKIAPEVGMTISVENQPGADQEATVYDFLIRSDDLAVTADLAPDNSGQTAYDFAARSVQITSRDKAHPVLKRLNITQREVAAHITEVKEGDTFDGSLKIASLEMNYAIHLEEAGQDSDVQGAIDDIEFTFSGDGFEFDTFQDFLDNDGLLEIAMHTGKTDITTKTAGGPVPMAMTGTTDSSGFEFSIRNGALSYQGDATKMAYQVIPDASVLPVPPFEMSMALARLRIDMPVAPSNLPSDAVFDLVFQDLVLDDTLWAMFDPEASIPRDPANLDIGMTAQIQVSPPAATSNPKIATKGPGEGDGETPNPFDFAKILSLNIDRAVLTAAGVAFDATGTMSFDNSGPIPLPLGTMDVNLAGAHALSSKLVALGLVDQMQVGMAMGMITAFAVPGDDPDSYVSKVEFRPEGIFANGAPVN